MTARRMVWEFIQARDYQVMRKVHRWRAPRWLRFWMIASTKLGDGWIWYSVGITLLLFGGDMRFIAFAASASAEAATVVLFSASSKRSANESAPATWNRTAGRMSSRPISSLSLPATP